MGDPKPPLDPSSIRTVSMHDRPAKVDESLFAGEVRPGMTVREWLASLPRILAASDLLAVARDVARARQEGRPVILGMGAHVIKVGLSPLLVSLMEDGVITGIGMNGAGMIHDFEIAVSGSTSEDVAAVLDTGMFGMTRETGEWLNQAALRCAEEDIGLGRAVGEAMLGSDFSCKDRSVMAACARLEVPLCVHVALGTDIIHMHPGASGSAIGRGSLRDFRIFSAMVAELEGGVYINLGSAVVMPEVFLKALSLARNLGHQVKHFTTVNMDFFSHYRPGVNVVERPTRTGGRGYRLVGHHEIMFPLLAAAIREEMAGEGQDISDNHRVLPVT